MTQQTSFAATMNFLTEMNQCLIPTAELIHEPSYIIKVSSFSTSRFHEFRSENQIKATASSWPHVIDSGSLTRTHYSSIFNNIQLDSGTMFPIPQQLLILEQNKSVFSSAVLRAAGHVTH